MSEPEHDPKTTNEANGDLDRAREILQQTYGYSDFRGLQEDIITATLQGQDALVLMPTGGGKSLCYQLPALVREGTGVIISPLIALMQDQVAALRDLGIKAAFLNSTQTPETQAEVIASLRNGTLQLLYVAPERLLQSRTVNLLREAQLSLIAIDEAHCVSQWGHDFRADYLQLDQLAELFPGVPRLALTATADPATREEIVTRLKLCQPQRFIAGFDRPNIHYRVASRSANPRSQLLQLLTRHRGESGIIYCMSRKRTEGMAAWLSEQGYPALPYHAGLSNAQREDHQARFLREDGLIMVATIAFGMGIDKPDVRFVAHIDLPRSLEAYYQETGRAGRDGQPAEAWMTYGLQDVVKQAQMIQQSQAPDDRKRIERGKLDALLAWCETTKCRRRALLAYFGEDYPAPCGNCDTCLEPPQTWDATEAAQKLLSCIYRTGQRFGAGHVLDVLLGRDTERVQQLGHQHLSTFGIGRGLTAIQWRGVLRQLMVAGYVTADAERYGALVLSPDCRPLLRGELRLTLREDVQEQRSRKAQALPSTAPADMDLHDEALWEALRELRRDLAQQNNLPPYVVFQDRTLKEMVALRPKSAEQLLQLTGVGQAKLDRYGEDFLTLLHRHER